MGKINKVKMITPMIVLTAESFAVVTMYIKKYDLYKMLWILLVVLIVFYLIGDAVRYTYMRIRPRVIPEADDIAKLISKVDPTRLQLDEKTLSSVSSDGSSKLSDVPADSVSRLSVIGKSNGFSSVFSDSEAGSVTLSVSVSAS